MKNICIKTASLSSKKMESLTYLYMQFFSPICLNIDQLVNKYLEEILR